MRDPEGLGGRTTFCVSIRGSEGFRSGGGGRVLAFLLDVLLINRWFDCNASEKKIQQKPCYDPLNQSKLEAHQLYMYPSAGKRAREKQ